jgi:hypothetical protein
MGHAGAIISGSSGTAQGKIDAMKAGGIHVCENLGTLGELCAIEVAAKDTPLEGAGALEEVAVVARCRRLRPRVDHRRAGLLLPGL